MAFQINTNSASAFRPREAGPADFTGNADIDTERYAVEIGPVKSGNTEKGHFALRSISFKGAENGLVFEGSIFDQRVDKGTGQARQLNEKAPQWSGRVAAKINDELTVTKKVAIWERTSPKCGLWLSVSIRDFDAPARTQQMVEENPF